MVDKAELEREFLLLVERAKLNAKAHAAEQSQGPALSAEESLRRAEDHCRMVIQAQEDARQARINSPKAKAAREAETAFLRRFMVWPALALLALIVYVAIQAFGPGSHD